MTQINLVFDADKSEYNAESHKKLLLNSASGECFYMTDRDGDSVLLMSLYDTDDEQYFVNIASYYYTVGDMWTVEQIDTHFKSYGPVTVKPVKSISMKVVFNAAKT